MHPAPQGGLVLTLLTLWFTNTTFAAEPAPEPVEETAPETVEEPSLDEELAAAEERLEELRLKMNQLNDPQGRLLDPASGRYLFAPSAIPQPKGHGYFSQKELAFSSVGYGVTNEFSVLGGSVLPAVLGGLANGELEALNGIVGFKYGQRLSPDFHMGAGAWAMVVSDASVAIPYVNMTYGDRYEHYTIAIGQTFLINEGDFGVMPVVFASHHATKTGAWITETWFVSEGNAEFGGPSLVVAASGAYRFMGKRLTVDLGLINVLPIGIGAEDFVYIPLPWLDFAWHWGDSLK